MNLPDLKTRRRGMLAACAAFAALLAWPAGAAPLMEDAPEATPAGPDEPTARIMERAVAYEHGEGVARDQAKASALYCEAAWRGEVEAMYALGWMYANGRGVPRNDAYAGTLFAMAGYLGHPQARQMARFTGYSGDLPDCINRPPRRAPPSQWHADPHIRSLPPDRQEIAQLVVELAANYEIAPRLALAIAMTESALNPLAVSPKYAIGVMQLIPGTAARFQVTNLLDPRENIRGGLAYLRWLLAHFRGDVALAAAAYNAGEGAVERYRGVPPYKETRAYVERILDFFGVPHHPFDSRVARPSAIFAGGRTAAADD